jgi:hypothetical protein
MYLRGIDLFNHGFYWESHEAWEAVWISAGRRGSVADFLKALIKVAAAGVKAREGREAGCVQLINGIQTSHLKHFCGLNLDVLKTAASALAGESCSVTQQASADVTAHVIPLVIVLSTDDGAT